MSLWFSDVLNYEEECENNKPHLGMRIRIEPETNENYLSTLRNYTVQLIP
jgi:hypothetical protein